MEHYDVIVVGQGPGGAAAAYEMARQGMNVLALAGQTKQKPCGGCLSVRWRFLFDYLGAPEWLWRHPVDNLLLAAPGQKTVAWRTQRPGAYFVERHQLDAWLNEKAGRAGARVIPQKASDIEHNGSGFTVSAGGQRFKSQWLIGADGAVSLTKRQLKFNQRSHTFTALVEERPLPPQLSSMLEGGALIELNGVPGGYGWLFARGEVLNMGIGSWGWKRRSSNNRFKEAYSAFLKRYALGEPGSYRGAAIPCPVAWAQTPVKGKAIWVGDAAALADPFLGEGIGQAICTGLQAARAILKNDMYIYVNSLKKGIFREHLHAWLLARLIYSRPGLSHRLVMRHPGALELGFGLLRGDVTHQTLWMFVLRKLLALNPSLDHNTQSNYIKILK